MASLTLYGSNVSNGTLTTASSMSSTTGGTEVAVQTTVTGTNQWVEVVSRAATLASVTAIGSPSGKGWVYAPGSGTFATGNWSATVTLSATSPGTTDVTIRFYKYSGGTYTSIGTINKTGITGTKTAYSFAATSMSSVTFGASDLLYVDLWWHDTSGADDNPNTYVSNSATAGVTNDLVVTTSSFSTVTTSSRTVPATIALLQTSSRNVPSTIALLASQTPRTVPATIALLSSQNPRTVPTTISLANEFSRVVPATFALDQPSSRTVPATIALLTSQNARNVPDSMALLSSQNPRVVPASISLAQSAVFYGSNVASPNSSLILSDQMSMVSGGTETSVSVTMPSSGNGYVELLAQGGTSSSTPALPAPSGKGWSIGLSGNTILAGSWSSVFTLAKSGSSMSGASLIVRWYRRTVDGIYYPIGLATLSSQTFNTTKTTYGTPSVSVVYPWQFIGGDCLYMDAYVLNGGTAWSSDIFTVYVSNSATMGVYNDAIIIAPEMIATPSELSCLVGATNFQTGTTLPIKDQSFTIADGLDQRSILTLTGEDAAGNLAFQRGMPVMLSDHDQGLLYAGAVNSDKDTKISADPSIAQTEHALTFMDAHYLTDKRANQVDYSNWTAGDIACDFIDKKLSQEGVTGAYAIESDYSPAAFSQGTLSGTVATTTTSPFTYAPNTATPPITSNTGDLELVRAGTQFTLTESVTSDFSSGTLTNMTASGNELSPSTQSAIKVTALFSPVATVANQPAQESGGIQTDQEQFVNSAYVQIWSGSQSVGSSDTFNYDIWISSTSPAFQLGMDIKFSDGSFLSNNIGTLDSNNNVGLFDQNGASVDNLQDLSSFAKDTWYTRNISIGSYSGKNVVAAYIFLCGSSSGTYTLFCKNCYIGSHSGSPIFSTTATATQLNPPVVTSTGGYLIPTINTSIVQVFNPLTSYRMSPAHSISGVGLVQNSSITWTASLPASGVAQVSYPPGTQASSSSTTGGGTMVMLVSYDGNCWLQCANSQALPGLPPGANVSGLSLYLREQFAAGTDPSAIPALLDVQLTINSAAAQTVSDVVATYGTTTQWNTGTQILTNPNSSGNLTLGGSANPIASTWSSGINDQLFLPGAANSGTQSTSGSAYTMTPGANTGGSWCQSRFDWAGYFQNGTIEADVKLSTTGFYTECGIQYRQTGWGNANNNGAYYVYISQNNLVGFGFGQNSFSNTSGSFQTVATTPETISAGTFYHLKIVVNGNRHTVYFNHSGTPAIDILDSTYTAAGQVGFRAFTSTNSSFTASIQNFTMVTTTSGTWTSPSTSLTSLGTCGYSQIAWTDLDSRDQVETTTTVLASVDGGSTWMQCTNGAEIPQLPRGTSTSGKSLVLQAILYSATPPISTPVLMGLYVRICGNYGTVSGTRISPALSLTPVGYVASSNCMWNANIPTSTTLTVQTTQDLSTYHTVGNNGAGEALPYWTNQPQSTQDLFATNTSANYTSTSKTGGSVASVTYTTTNSSLTLTGGSSALYLNNAISCSDVDMFADMDMSDAGGLAFRVVSTSNYYELAVHDASSNSGFVNQLRLYKVSGGTRSLLGSASIVFTRTTFHRIRVTVEGSLINAYFDGTCKLSILDVSPLGSGQTGQRNDGGTSRYYQLWIQPLGVNLSGQVLYTKVTMSTSDPSMMPQLFALVACIRGASIATGATISQLHPVSRPFAAYYSAEMDYLVQLSGDYYWYIDRWRQLHFGPRLARPGAFPIQSVADPAGSAGYLLYQPQVSILSSADLFRNGQIVTNVSSLVSPPPEIKVSDGSTTSWSMGYPLYSAPTVLVNGQPATVGIQGIDNNRQFYWQPQSASISYDSSLPKLPAGTVISFTYVGTSIVNVTLNNTDSQAVQAALELNSGIVEQIESALNSTSQGMSVDQATTFGNGLLSRYGNNAAIELIGTTLYAGLAPGTVVSLFLPELMRTWNAQIPIVKLTTTGYQSVNGLVYLFSIDATNGPNISNWARLWQK